MMQGGMVMHRASNSFLRQGFDYSGPVFDFNDKLVPDGPRNLARQPDKSVKFALIGMRPRCAPGVAIVEMEKKTAHDCRLTLVKTGVAGPRPATPARLRPAA